MIMKYLKFVYYPLLGAVVLPVVLGFFVSPILFTFYLIETYNMNILYGLPIAAMLYGAMYGLVGAFHEFDKKDDDNESE